MDKYLAITCDPFKAMQQTNAFMGGEAVHDVERWGGWACESRKA